MARKFKWDSWDFDCDGVAYIIAKAECPEREKVPAYIVEHDNLSAACAPDMVVEEGWCAFQCRTDWENGDGEPRGYYVVETQESNTKRFDGRRKPGWFPVWIVRQGEWY